MSYLSKSVSVWFYRVYLAELEFWKLRVCTSIDQYLMHRKSKKFSYWRHYKKCQLLLFFSIQRAEMPFTVWYLILEVSCIDICLILFSEKSATPNLNKKSKRTGDDSKYTIYFNTKTWEMNYKYCQIIKESFIFHGIPIKVVHKGFLSWNLLLKRLQEMSKVQFNGDLYLFSRGKYSLEVSCIDMFDTVFRE